MFVLKKEQRDGRRGVNTKDDSCERREKRIRNEGWEIMVAEKAEVEREERNDRRDAGDKTAWTGESVRQSEKDEGVEEACLFLRQQRRIGHMVDTNYWTRIILSVPVLFK